MATPTNTPEQKTTKLGIPNPVYTTNLETGDTSFQGQGYVKPAPQAPEQTVQPTETIPTLNFKDQRATTLESTPVPFTDITKKAPQEIKPTEIKPVTLKSGQEVQLNTQEMKMREQNLKAQETQIVQQEKQAKMTDLSSFLAGNPTNESINRYLKINYKPEYKLDYQNTLRNYFKQTNTNTKIQKYSVAPVEVIDEAVKSGDLVPGSDAYNNLTPEKRAEYENYSRLKQASTITEPYVAPKTDFTSIFNELKNVFSTSYQKEFKDKLNSPEKLQMDKDLENISNEISQIDTDIATMEKDRAKVNKGVPSSLQRAENADKQEALLLKKNTLINQYNSKKATLDSYKADIETELKLIQADDENNKQAYMTALSLYNTERARMDAIEQRAFEEQSKIRAEERQRGFQKEMIELEQKYTKENKTPKYELGRDGKMYAIVDGVATEVMATTGEVLFGEETEDMTTSVQRNDDGTYTVFQIPKKGGSPQITTYGASGEIAGGSPIGVQEIISKCQTKGQCGAGVNDYLQNLGIGRVMGDSYESKAKYIQPGVGPQVGRVAIWNPNQGQGKFKENGHTGIVTGYNPDTGKVTITDWNWNGDEKQLTHEVNLSEITYNGGFYNPVMEQQTAQYDEAKIPQYTEYIEDGKIPTGYKPGTARYTQFINEAQAGYMASKNQSLKTKGFEIADINSFSGTSKKQKEDISTAINNVMPFIQSMDKAIALVKTEGTALPFTEAGKKINQEIRNAQLLAKEIYNLGVLNGPDLALMESIIANPTNISSLATGWQDYSKILENGKKTILDNAIAKAESVGLKSIIPTTTQEQSVQQKPQTGGLIQEYNSRPKLDIDN